MMFGVPSWTALPDQTTGSGRNLFILLLTRKPVSGQSTVTHSAV
jgi:hypothetical protein